MNRCSVCKKKLNLIELECYKCRCENNFCKIHSSILNHTCTYDYIKENKKILNKKLKPIEPQKVIKI